MSRHFFHSFSFSASFYISPYIILSPPTSCSATKGRPALYCIPLLVQSDEISLSFSFSASFYINPYIILSHPTSCSATKERPALYCSTLFSQWWSFFSFSFFFSLYKALHHSETSHLMFCHQRKTSIYCITAGLQWVNLSVSFFLFLSLPLSIYQHQSKSSHLMFCHLCLSFSFCVFLSLPLSISTSLLFCY